MASYTFTFIRSDGRHKHAYCIAGAGMEMTEAMARAMYYRDGYNAALDDGTTVEIADVRQTAGDRHEIGIDVEVPPESNPATVRYVSEEPEPTTRASARSKVMTFDEWSAQIRAEAREDTVPDYPDRDPARIFRGFPGRIHPGVVTLDGSDLDPRHDLRNHSPDGLAWGYGGSGPAQCALAMCAEVVGDERAQAIYQDFKRAFVERLPGSEEWAVTANIVLMIIEALEVEREATRPRSDSASKGAA